MGTGDPHESQKAGSSWGPEWWEALCPSEHPSPGWTGTPSLFHHSAPFSRKLSAPLCALWKLPWAATCTQQLPPPAAQPHPTQPHPHTPPACSSTKLAEFLRKKKKKTCFKELKIECLCQSLKNSLCSWFPHLCRRVTSLPSWVAVRTKEDDAGKVPADAWMFSAAPGGARAPRIHIGSGSPGPALSYQKKRWRKDWPLTAPQRSPSGRREPGPGTELRAAT